MSDLRNWTFKDTIRIIFGVVPLGGVLDDPSPAASRDTWLCGSAGPAGVDCRAGNGRTDSRRARREGAAGPALQPADHLDFRLSERLAALGPGPERTAGPLRRGVSGALWLPRRTVSESWLSDGPARGADA